MVGWVSGLFYWVDEWLVVSVDEVSVCLIGKVGGLVNGSVIGRVRMYRIR